MLRGGSRVEQEVTPEFAWRRALLRNDVTDRAMARLPSDSGYGFTFDFQVSAAPGGSASPCRNCRHSSPSTSRSRTVCW